MAAAPKASVIDSKRRTTNSESAKGTEEFCQPFARQLFHSRPNFNKIFKNYIKSQSYSQKIKI
jgi:hypothetical protein